MKINSYQNFENEVFEKLSEKTDIYSPIKVEKASRGDELPGKQEGKKPDGVIELSYQERKLRLIIEIKNRTAPTIIEKGIQALDKISVENEYKNYIPTLVVPYLTEEISEMLSLKKMSGLDLNGNYYIALDDFVAIRLDKKNEYKESAYIRNIYSKNSSMVGRLLLQENRTYEKVSEVYEAIQQLNGNITLSTVSKVLIALAEQLIVSKERSKIRLLQPKKLLNNLRNEYKNPAVQQMFRLRLPSTKNDSRILLDKYFNDNWIWSGESCVENYATTTPINQSVVFTKKTYNSKELLEHVDIRFYNCSVYVLPTLEQFVFFDSRDRMASKMQTYLELSQLDKREKEIALDIEKDILNEFK